MMKLKKFIKSQNKTITEAAKEIGVSRQSLSYYCNSKIRPKIDTAKAVEKWSVGQISAIELLGL